ncbi:hypothetical protein HDU97_005164 [Phlyctochytrium planicorne]|nr:hypothetical protein HDU97_005164 [Phlyctochytrium planicorne]
MVNVSHKPETHRIAKASGHVRFSNPEAFNLLQDNAIAKGDVLTVSKIAGINAAKATSNLIPLSHPIPLTRIGVEFKLSQDDLGVEIVSTVETISRTGVEVEAVVATSVAACTVFDMCKAVDKAIVITDIRVIHKSGGKSGEYNAPSR